MSDLTEKPISELFHTVVEWALTKGADGAHSRPGTWKATTEPTSDHFACSVVMNPHLEECDGIPAVSARITPADEMGPMAVCITHPYGGVATGFNEDALIEHFRGQS